MRREFFLRHIKLFRMLMIAIAVAAIVSSCSKLIRSPLAKGDTSVYTHAAQNILRGENIYASTQVPPEQGGSYYLYLPLLAILFIPLSFLPINVIIVLWCLLSVFLVYWSVKNFFEAMKAGDYIFIVSGRPVDNNVLSDIFTSRYIPFSIRPKPACILSCSRCWCLP